MKDFYEDGRGQFFLKLLFSKDKGALYRSVGAARPFPFVLEQKEPNTHGPILPGSDYFKIRLHNKKFLLLSWQLLKMSHANRVYDPRKEKQNNRGCIDGIHIPKDLNFTFWALGGFRTYSLQAMMYSILLFVSFLFHSVALAQSRQDIGTVAGANRIVPLRAGDKLPEEFWKQEYLFYRNGDTVRQTLDVYRGKAIILDFWAQWCTPCLVSLGKVNTFAHQLSGNGVFIPVTSDKLTSVQSVWKKQGFTLPSVIGDTILGQFFPRASIPHVVWIDAEGTVAHITNQQPLDESNMSDFFKGAELEVAQKTAVDKNRPLLLDTRVDPSSVENYQLVLKGKQEGMPMLKFTRSTPQGVFSKTYINRPLLLLYKGLAYDLFYGLGQTMFEKDFQIADIDPAILNEIYTLDIISPSNTEATFYSHLVDLLNTASGLEAGMDSEQRQCLVLKKLNGDVVLGTAGGERLRQVDWNGHIDLRNLPLPSFQGILMDDRLTGKYIVNETGYKGNIDAQLTVTSDLAELNRQLAKMGLQLEEAIRDVTIFTIKKPKPNEHE
ncbi:TlpA family protein disulfide reductase [Sphingobacterium hungaricum]|uniref:Thioredoxin domain-containing protein n=1 Tax=Sphingobacterium hungaricum TaxID=2082723 RepID=A0A928UXH7_9SPHI|nr:TlpA disulfide reductase family protein [Sphingobacterium hungaricum]MBE8714818.1 hypothetical protein [Sphingobacterium hungaricum]